MSSNAPSRHHPFGPSRWYLFDKCPGARRLCELLAPGDPGEPAKRGSRIHEMAAELILAGEHEIDGADPSELAVAMEIAAFARKEIAANPGMAVHVEEEVSYSTIDGEMYFGTCDLMLVGDGNGRIYDWKTGFNKVDEACDNWQGAGYALAAMQKFNLRHVEVCFFNPVIGQETRHLFPDAGALSIQIDRLNRRTMDSNAPFCTGDHCAICEAGRQAVCKSRMMLAETSCNLAEDGTARPIAEWSDAAVCLWIRRLGNVARMLDALKDEAIARCEANGKCGSLVVKCQSGGREAADISSVAFALEKYVSTEDILACCNLSVSKLKAVAVDRLVTAGDADTKKNAGVMFEAMLSGLLVEKPARKCLKEEQE